MTTETIILRNKISKRSEVFRADLAHDLLEDPNFKDILEVVRTDKPEVLSQPYGGATAADGVRPDDTALKQDWVDYAVTQGFDGDADSITKADLIKKYGADKDKD